MTAEEEWRALVQTMLAESDATYANDESKGARRMFGSTSIKTGGKMFAFLHKKERLIVKLPEERVNELVTAGKGDRYDPGDGRLQREWFRVTSDSPGDWLSFAREAEIYVGKLR